MKLHNIFNRESTSVKVDDINEIDLVQDEKDEVINNICNWIKKHPEHLRLYIEIFTNTFGENKVLDETPDPETGLIVTENCLDLDI